jgi:hypothetical protein
LTHLITIWDCDDKHNHINVFVGQQCQDHYADPDIHGWGFLLPPLYNGLFSLVCLLFYAKLISLRYFNM